MERCYRALGYGFRIRTDLEEVGAYLDRLLERFRTGDGNGVPTYVVLPPGEESERYTVLLDGECVHRAATPPPLVDYVLWHVSSQALEGAREFIALHAGAASWKGRGILLPAPSGSGKTTLTAALAREGFRYLSDEAALIHPDTGRLHAFPRPLWVKAPSVEVLDGIREMVPRAFRPAGRRNFHVAPSDLGGAKIGEPCRVRHVVAPRYVRGAETALQPMPRAEAVSLLAENSFNFPRFGDRGLRTLAEVVRGASCHRLTVGDLGGAVWAVTELVRGGA